MEVSAIVKKWMIVAAISTIATDNACALDYDASAFWEFTTPTENPVGFWRRLKDNLVYDATTGELVYEDVDADGWFPPDILSLAGVFLEDTALGAVPLHNGSVWDESGLPYWERDAALDRVAVLGSVALRVNYDPYKFWPYSSSDEQILASYGLDSVPARHSYGRVLPRGLSREFLEEDLISTTFATLIVVPEPSSVAMVLFVATCAMGASKPRA